MEFAATTIAPARQPSRGPGGAGRVAALLGVMVLLLAAGAAAATVEVTVAPESDTLMVDDEIDLFIRVDAAATGLKTLQVDMSYDGSVLEVLDVRMGNLYASSGFATFFQDLSEPDTVSAAMSVLGPNVSVDGPGEILEVTVRAIAPGLSLQKIEEAILLDVDGGQFGYDVSDGMIWVDAGTVGIVPTGPGLWLRPAVQPAVGLALIDYAAGDGAPPVLTWYDARGRRQGARSLAPGRGRVTLRLGPAGVYWVELRQRQLVDRTRIVWLP